MGEKLFHSIGLNDNPLSSHKSWNEYEGISDAMLNSITSPICQYFALAQNLQQRLSEPFEKISALGTAMQESLISKIDCVNSLNRQVNELSNRISSWALNHNDFHSRIGEYLSIYDIPTDSYKKRIKNYFSKYLKGPQKELWEGRIRWLEIKKSYLDLIDKISGSIYVLVLDASLNWVEKYIHRFEEFIIYLVKLESLPKSDVDNRIIHRSKVSQIFKNLDDEHITVLS